MRLRLILFCALSYILSDWGAQSAHALPPPPSAQRFMVIVAHQDDDGLMFAPDLQSVVTANRPIQTVYLTSGDAGFECSDYTQSRERGAKAAHAFLAGVPNVWSDEERVVRGKRVRVSTLLNTQQTLVFLGLPNRVVVPSDPTIGPLQQLWSGAVPRVTTLSLDGRSGVDSYSKEELIETLRELIGLFNPDDVRTLDASELQPLTYPFEHSDHVHAALFALTALQRRATSAAFTMYRSYSIVFEKENLTTAMTETRRSMFGAYRAHDPKICDALTTQVCGQTTTCDPYTILYEPFFPRNYPIETRIRERTAIRAFGGLCLEASGTSLRFALCNPFAGSQQWALAQGGTIRNLASGACLRANGVTAGSLVGLARCAREREQQFFMTSQGQLRGPEATCVSAFGQPNLGGCGWDPFKLSWSVD